ncbi:hypothetical protein H6G18_07105 [Anabaena subtropica FACHB-260]|uniref:Uncharacterized protein n=1 Tax=Anabaena subtropica FACHB-260 TaxID=2692884 RepID=A0ABR8CL72_9NOST|nr:hypothetical protein [Anabaena subtropica]MBD2343915.1 hypothetical protein [Anabaena subtropica FACHB-260]
MFTSLKTQFLHQSTQILPVNYPINPQIYAPVFTSLKDRDWKALLELFDREDIDEVEADINGNLLLMIPEPCWEDDPFDFLREYL